MFLSIFKISILLLLSFWVSDDKHVIAFVTVSWSSVHFFLLLYCSEWIISILLSSSSLILSLAPLFCYWVHPFSFKNLVMIFSNSKILISFFYTPYISLLKLLTSSFPSRVSDNSDTFVISAFASIDCLLLVSLRFVGSWSGKSFWFKPEHFGYSVMRGWVLFKLSVLIEFLWYHAGRGSGGTTSLLLCRGRSPASPLGLCWQ